MPRSACPALRIRTAARGGQNQKEKKGTQKHDSDFIYVPRQDLPDVKKRL